MNNFPITRGFKVNISMKLITQYMAIFLNFSPSSNHLHPLQVENCDSNSWLVVDEDDNGKFRPERVKEALNVASISSTLCVGKGSPGALQATQINSLFSFKIRQSFIDIPY